MNFIRGKARLLVIGTVFCLGAAGSPFVVSSAMAQEVRADADIQSDVANALTQSQQLQGQNITAATINGDVTLSGTVRDDASKQLAEQLAAGVNGVRSVTNNLAVSSAASQPAPAPAQQQSEEQVPPPPLDNPGVSQPNQAQSNQNYPPAQQQQPIYQQPVYQQPAYQQPSGPVTIPEGTLLNVRTSEPLDARRVQIGSMFQATVANDIFSGNVLAIPRGAVVTGQVVDVQKSGDLAGKSGLQLQITSLQLGGQAYSLATDAWKANAPNKAGYSAGNTVGGAALGAMIGAIAGGGPGAAIGAVAGGTTGLAASAATKGPQVVIPPEAMLSFHLVTPVMVTPVSYQEAQRLADSVQPQQPRLMRRPAYMAAPYPYPYYYPYYYGPGYYYNRY
ncbi:MAG TPA: BON domain-containing protein [Pseudacidobacterium sp.]|nr:BON domain-containing protein [Pseudacidobacterium sp.]